LKKQYTKDGLINAILKDDSFSVRMHLYERPDLELVILDDQHRSCLLFAIKHGKEKVIEQLLKMEIPLNHQDSYGLTALMYGVLSLNLSLCQKLLDLDCEIRGKNKDGLNTLELAQQVQKEIVTQSPANIFDVDQIQKIITLLVRAQEGIERRNKLSTKNTHLPIFRSPLSDEVIQELQKEEDPFFGGEKEEFLSFTDDEVSPSSSPLANRHQALYDRVLNEDKDESSLNKTKKRVAKTLIVKGEENPFDQQNPVIEKKNSAYVFNNKLAQTAEKKQKHHKTYHFKKDQFTEANSYQFKNRINPYNGSPDYVFRNNLAPEKKESFIKFFEIIRDEKKPFVINNKIGQNSTETEKKLKIKKENKEAHDMFAPVNKFMSIIEEGDIGKVTHFMEPFNFANNMDKDGNTPLIIAAQSHHYQIVDMLLKKGARPNLMNNLGHTALYYSVLENDLKVVHLLLQRGSNLRIRYNGKSLLMLAAAKGHFELVKILLLSGADPFIQDYNGRRAKDHALTSGHKKMYKFLQMVERDIKRRAA